MKNKLIVLISIISFFTNISFSIAGTWVEKSGFSAPINESINELTNDKSPLTSNEGLYAKYWCDGNDVGYSLTGWLLTQDKKRPSLDEIHGNLFNGTIKHSLQWSERNPPKAAFSCGWTEVLYVQHKGNCDNGDLFNFNGKAKVTANCSFNFASGPEHDLDNYKINYYMSVENSESKVSKSPKLKVLESGKEYDLISPNWDNKPDKKKSWNASGGDITSFSIGMDNHSSNNSVTNNIFIRGAIGSTIDIELQNKAKSSLASIFEELSGFELVLDGELPTPQNNPVFLDESVNYDPRYRMQRIWKNASHQAGWSFESSSKISALIQGIYAITETQNLDEDIVTKSIKRYLKQFAYTFEGEYKEQANYYLAWLLARAATRPVQTSEEVTNTKDTFMNLIENINNVLYENAKQAIGNSISTEIQEVLDEELAKVKGKLLYYYYELSEDPLFPAFKEPIDNDIEKLIVQKLEDEKILFNLLNNQTRMETENEFYKKWLRFYFERVSERVVFWLVIETNKDEFRNPKYWGVMQYRAKSIRNGLWPVEIYLSRSED